MMLKNLTIFLFISISLFSEVEFLQIDDLEKYQFKLCEKYKDIARHKLYCNKDYFYKVWGQDQKKGDRFLRVYQMGIYDRIAPLAALIFDEKGLCIGYMTKRCQPITEGDYTPSNISLLDFSVKHPPDFMKFLAVQK